MPDRVFVYVDGESHYIQSERAWKRLHGPDACLARLRYTGTTDDRLVLVNEDARVFWSRRMSPGVVRATYFTAVSPDPQTIHYVKMSLRRFDVDPFVIEERRQLADRREYLLSTQCVIEKPKGVDIALAVRMLEDSYNHAFDACHLYTSDVDFVPVIHAVRSRGKPVLVYGYTKGLSQQHSDLLTVPDLFTDLEDVLRTNCELTPSDQQKAE